MSDTYNKIGATVGAFVDPYQEAFDTRDATALSKTLTPDCLGSMISSIFAEMLKPQRSTMSVTGYEAMTSCDVNALESGHVDLEKQMNDTEKKTE
jgi:hypothetical protein